MLFFQSDLCVELRNVLSLSMDNIFNNPAAFSMQTDGGAWMRFTGDSKLPENERHYFVSSPEVIGMLKLTIQGKKFVNVRFTEGLPHYPPTGRTCFIELFRGERGGERREEKKL